MRGVRKNRYREATRTLQSGVRDNLRGCWSSLHPKTSRSKYQSMPYTLRLVGRPPAPPTAAPFIKRSKTLYMAPLSSLYVARKDKDSHLRGHNKHGGTRAIKKGAPRGPPRRHT